MLICVCNARALQTPPPNHASSSTEAGFPFEKRNDLQNMTLLHSPVRLHL